MQPTLRTHSAHCVPLSKPSTFSCASCSCSWSSIIQPPWVCDEAVMRSPQYFFAISKTPLSSFRGQKYSTSSSNASAAVP